MKKSYYIRMNRYYLSQEYEMWSVELDYGDGFLSEDKIVIKFGSMYEVLCCVRISERVNDEYYYGYLLKLFENLTCGEGSFEVKRIVVGDIEEYDIDDLKQLHSKQFGCNINAQIIDNQK